MQDAVRQRRIQPALRADGHQNVYHVNDGAEVLAFHRWTDGGDDLVIDIIREGTKRANETAEETLWRAKEAMGLDFYRRTLG